MADDSLWSALGGLALRGTRAWRAEEADSLIWLRG